MSEVRAKKALGQHFLVDLNIARKICDSLSGGEIRLRTAPAVAALPGADGQAAAGRGPEEPETVVIVAAKRGTGNAAERCAAAGTGEVAGDGRTAEIAAAKKGIRVPVLPGELPSEKLGDIYLCKSRQSALTKSGNQDELTAAVRKTYYGKRYPELTPHNLDQYYTEIRHKIQSKEARNNPYSVATMVSYLYEKEHEVDSRCR